MMRVPTAPGTQVFGAVYLDCGQHPKTMIPCVESIIASGALADGALLVLQPTDSNLKEGALQDQMGLLEFAAATAAKAGGYKVAKLTELALHKRHPNLPLLVLQLTAGAGRKSATAPGAPAGSAGVARVMLGHLQRKLQLLPGSGKCYVKGDTPKTAHARLGCSDAHILDDDTGRLAPCKKCAPCAAGGKLLQASSILEGAPKWLDVPAAAPVAPVAAAGAAPLAAAPAAALSAAPAATVVALAAPAAAKARTQAAPDVCFVTDKGNKKHRSRACRTLSKSTVLQKSVAEAEAHGKKEWCKVCPKD